MLQINRVILNFTSRCDMRCTYCYVPFDHRRPDPEMPFRVIERCHELGASAITIAGANPFLFPDLRNLVIKAKELIGFVHIDTNLLRNDDARVISISRSVDLLGVPLDGSLAVIHDRVRSARGHYHVVLRLLPLLISSGVHVKVNTVITAENMHDVKNIARLVCELKPATWSIYEFWPMERGLANRLRHQTVADFHLTAQPLRELASGVHVEFGSITDRAQHYFFVNDRGLLYTIDPASTERYVFLGSVFDDSVVQRWGEIASGTLRRSITLRYSYAKTTGRN
ncbi:radical SAM protein [Bradyrhizobium sp. RT3a]|uniref:radical SAM protein n=1 Tax=unclassified Bradyrhizobium TaxID=2631580 RepID=UPI003398E12E